MALTIAVTGQILLHGPLESERPESAAIRSMLAADMTFANLEATVETPDAWPTKTKTLHLAGADALPSLKALGFSAVTHANNHAFDLGPPGIAATRKAAMVAGLDFAGSGATVEEACAPTVLAAANGKTLALLAVDLGPQPDIVYASIRRAGIAPLRMKRTVIVPPQDYETLRRIVETLGDDRRKAARSAVGYDAAQNDHGRLDVFGTHVAAGERIGAHWSADADDLRRLVSGIEKAKADGHSVALSLHSHHWDAEWGHTPGWLTVLAHSLIDAGADLIIGTGAPVLQGLSFYRGRPVMAGLGNFVFHTRRAETYDEKGIDVWRSVVARLTLADDGSCSGIEVLPVAVGRPAESGVARAPVPLPGEEARQVFARFTASLSAEEAGLVRLCDRGF